MGFASVLGDMSGDACLEVGRDRVPEGYLQLAEARKPRLLGRPLEASLRQMAASGPQQPTVLGHYGQQPFVREGNSRHQCG